MKKQFLKVACLSTLLAFISCAKDKHSFNAQGTVTQKSDDGVSLPYPGIGVSMESQFHRDKIETASYVAVTDSLGRFMLYNESFDQGQTLYFYHIYGDNVQPYAVTSSRVSDGFTTTEVELNPVAFFRPYLQSEEVPGFSKSDQQITITTDGRIEELPYEWKGNFHGSLAATNPVIVQGNSMVYYTISYSIYDWDSTMTFEKSDSIYLETGAFYNDTIKF